MLDDILETQTLLGWHERVGKSELIPTMKHYNLNYHALAFEQVDHYLRNIVVVLSSPQTYF